ncbi:hypothetical protein B0T25DRAFT_243835 [Lasiosphaeria hispida]|uniref:Secreted protein n=1 Tax=Lasiosphaeria hispida TaxID=260671 RepID=A0AAJ0MCF4_9PEZI|nr:hypothetical protein B0T25DRAFT_243835 [Lasiosphaeria hispida]
MFNLCSMNLQLIGLFIPPLLLSRAVPPRSLFPSGRSPNEPPPLTDGLNRYFHPTHIRCPGARGSSGKLGWESGITASHNLVFVTEVLSRRAWAFWLLEPLRVQAE